MGILSVCVSLHYMYTWGQKSASGFLELQLQMVVSWTLAFWKSAFIHWAIFGAPSTMTSLCLLPSELWALCLFCKCFIHWANFPLLCPVVIFLSWKSAHLVEGKAENLFWSQAVVAHTFSSSTWERQTEFLSSRPTERVPEWPGLHSETLTWKVSCLQENNYFGY